MLFKLEALSKGFGMPGSTAFRPVLKEANLEISEGESIAILGPSGSGKTTLLNIIAALEKPDSGKVLFRGKDIQTLKGREIEEYRNQEIGFVFQFHHLLPQCTLKENILIPTLMLRDKNEIKEKQVLAEQLLKKLEIWDHHDKLPSQMSGGECQRAAVVRAMINKPSILLADEPTGALDAKNTENIAELLRNLNKNENLSILLVTHSEKLASRMEKVYRLEDGKLKLS
jgi:ABC-type lipoprotein export system ATPase subunit